MILHNFIVFEGIDGTGTSTQLKILEDRLKEKKTWFTSEPTGSETGKFLRRMLKGEFTFHEKTAAYLFAADRCEHLYGANGIENHIKDGYTVFSDRYVFSSLAYQSALCGEKLVKYLNVFFPLPEYVFFFDMDPEESLKRIDRRGEKEIYEKADILAKIRKEYIKVMKHFEENKPENCHLIFVDASKSIEEVSAFIWTSLENLPIFKK